MKEFLHSWVFSYSIVYGINVLLGSCRFLPDPKKHTRQGLMAKSTYKTMRLRVAAQLTLFNSIFQNEVLIIFAYSREETFFGNTVLVETLNFDATI